MTHRNGLRYLVAACCIATSAAAAQEQEQEAVFKSGSDLVVLHVTVVNGRSDAVPDLPQNAFHVFEEDQPQKITFFNSQDVPVAAGLVLDASASMITRQRLAVAGAAAFARSSRPGDEMFTIHFNEHVQFGLPETMPFTSQASLLQASVAKYRARGKTALHDAVIDGLDHLERSSAQKRVLVVLSDGEDNASRRSAREMMDRAARSNAIVYTVSNANRRDGTTGDAGVLRKLASISGGIAYFPDSEEDIVTRFDRIAGDIRRGYTIGYVPAASRAPGYRRVKVVVNGPDRGRLDVRSREGYWVGGDVSPR